MFQKLGVLAVVAGLVLPALAADKPGSISGYVRSGGGVPQMGAMVEVLSAAAHDLRVFTDERGFYSISDLIPGTYSVKVTAPSCVCWTKIRRQRQRRRKAKATT